MTVENVPYVTKIPRAPGIYSLLIVVGESLTVRIGSLGVLTIPTGNYVYLGSAKGPGGLRARIARHLSKNKKIRWHIDYILAAGPVRIDTIVFAQESYRRECVLTPSLEESGFTHPRKGLGSSDCRSCTSHFLKCPYSMLDCTKAVVGAFKEAMLEPMVIRV